MTEERARIRVPAEGELLCKIVELLGDDRARIACQDGKLRIGRIPGKYRRRLWIKGGDIVIAVPWDFDPRKADIIHKYEKNEIPDLRSLGYGEIIDKLEEMYL